VSQWGGEMAETKSRYAPYYGLRAPAAGETAESYETLILRHVQALDRNTTATREAVYSRVRSVMLKTLHDQQVGIERLITEKKKLEDAIERIEFNFTQSHEGDVHDWKSVDFRKVLANETRSAQDGEASSSNPLLSWVAGGDTRPQGSALNPLLSWALWVLGLSALAVILGGTYIHGHQVQVAASAFGAVRDPNVNLAVWSLILGVACFLIGIGLLIGGVYVQSSTRR
jgi:hypothetical protein